MEYPIPGGPPPVVHVRTEAERQHDGNHGLDHEHDAGDPNRQLERRAEALLVKLGASHGRAEQRHASCHEQREERPDGDDAQAAT